MPHEDRILIFDRSETEGEQDKSTSRPFPPTICTHSPHYLSLSSYSMRTTPSAMGAVGHADSQLSCPVGRCLPLDPRARNKLDTVGTMRLPALRLVSDHSADLSYARHWCSQSHLLRRRSCREAQSPEASTILA